MSFASLSIPELELLAALEEGRSTDTATPIALAPTPGGRAVVEAPSGQARAFGIRAGMGLGEALARCPQLELIPPDPVAVADLWERVLTELEGIGAAVQPGAPGDAYFEVEGLLGMHRDLTGLADTAVSAVESVLDRSARITLGFASSPFAARLAAGLERVPGREIATERRLARARLRFVAPGRSAALLAPLAVHTLSHALEDPDEAGSREAILAFLPDLGRLGLDTLGSLAALEIGMLADRFGRPGLRARRLARGEAEPLRPRTRGAVLEEELELPDSLDGTVLATALELLIERLLALPERRGRSIRSLTLSATLAGGGSWRTEVAFNLPTASAETIRLVAVPRLAGLPGPATSLAVRADRLGGEDLEQIGLGEGDGHERRERLREAVRQTRVAAGPDSLLRVLELDPDSHLPERRATLSPLDVESSRGRQ